ncbi:MAG: hypothetical protein FWD34_10405 [Oscillospiraceae bacterium]|nr:hypothetical protein [Oscillospiraceae bacterium]
MNKNSISKIAWGLFLVAAAALIISNALYEFMGFFPLIVLIVLAPIAVISIIHRSFGGIFIPIAIVAVLFDEQLGIEAITPLPVIVAAILLTIAFEIMFRKNGFVFIGGKADLKNMESIEDGDMSCSVKFGESTKYFTNENLEKAYLKCEFGALIAYFDGATLNPNGATLYLEANFSGVELFVPKHWNVENSISVFLGAVDEKGKNIPDPDSPVLTIVGKASFAGVEIHYV